MGKAHGRVVVVAADPSNESFQARLRFSLGRASMLV